MKRGASRDVAIKIEVAREIIFVLYPLNYV